MDTLSYIIGRNMGGGSATTPSWNDVENKPFETIGTGLTVSAGALEATGSATVDWDDVENKPTFATVATSGDYGDLLNTPTIPVVPTDVSAFTNDAGYITSADLPAIDNDSLYLNSSFAIAVSPTFAEGITSGLATESYVNGATAGVYDSITNTLQAYALTTDIPDVSSFITASALTPYVEASSLATVATTGLYSDLSGAPTIPAVSATSSLATGTTIGSIEIDGATTTFYAPTPTSVAVAQSLTTGTAIADIDVDGVTTTLYAPQGGGSVVPRYDAGGAVGGGFIKEATFTSIAANQIQMSVRNTEFAIGMSSNKSYYFKLNVNVNGETYPLVFKMNTGVDFNWTSTYASQAQMSDYTIEGGEQIIGNTEIVSTIFRITLKTGWAFADTVVSRSDYIDTSSGAKGYNINSLFIPVDNSTIKKNASGQLYTNIPASVDFNYALDNGLVDGLSQVQEAQDTINNQSYDEWGQPEYAGGIEKCFSFRYVENFAIDGDEANRVTGYIWQCEFASAIPNPDYGNDPEGGGDEPEPEPEEEPEG